MLRFRTSTTLLLQRLGPHCAFIALYVFLDWASFIEPMHGLNITTWNPPPALGFVYWLRYGKKAALPWFLALTIAEIVVQNQAGGWLAPSLFALCLTLGYGFVAEVLRRRFKLEKVFDNRRELSGWFVIVASGALLNALIYVTALYAAQLIGPDEWLEGVRRYWIGDIVGVMISMPIFWMLASSEGRLRLRQTVLNWEALGYCLFMGGLIWFIFGLYQHTRFHHFYFMFLPIVWAASRQGIPGAALVAGVMQLNIIAATGLGYNISFPLTELQLLLSVLALVSLFIGIVVDEQKAIAQELTRSMRLAAAGEMAAALAHELNQPITAMVAYGKSCEELMQRQQGDSLFREVLGRMVAESSRAANVVRRLKEFFQTGAMDIEPTELGSFLEQAAVPFAVQARQTGIVLELGSMAPVITRLDRLQMELVLRNLLQNAFDAVTVHPEGARHVAMSLESQQNGTVEVTITDNGPGVADNMREGLFEPFVSSKSSGMGLGLALSRNIVEAHGGTLWAEFCDHGKFKFVLPRMEATISNV